MRIVLSFLLVLFGVSNAQSQAPTSSVPAPAQAPMPTPAQTLPAVIPAPAAPERPTEAEEAARVEVAAPGDEAQPREPRRSRMFWALIGAVVVLGVVLALTL